MAIFIDPFSISISKNPSRNNYKWEVYFQYGDQDEMDSGSAESYDEAKKQALDSLRELASEMLEQIAGEEL